MDRANQDGSLTRLLGGQLQALFHSSFEVYSAVAHPSCCCQTLVAFCGTCCGTMTAQRRPQKRVAVAWQQAFSISFRSMRGALSGLLAAAAVLASNAKEFKFRAPARGEKYNTTRTWDADAPITVHIMPQ